MGQKRFYILIGVLMIVGVLWVVFSQISTSNTQVCLFKNVTGLACPSCGITRAFSMVFAGQVLLAVALNPLVLIVTPLVLVIPVMWVYDIALKKQLLWNAYSYFNRIMQKKPIAICAIVIVLAVWGHNIAIGL